MKLSSSVGVAVLCCLGLSPKALLGASEGHLAKILPPSESCDVVGVSRTEPDTLCELLPRSLPAVYSDEDLQELGRRVVNLAVFDHVAVVRVGNKIEIRVREKWTLIPSIEFATGQGWEDLYLFLGLTEYNAFGRAAQLGGGVSREQRGYNFYIWFQPHVYHPKLWTPNISLFRESAELHFPNSEAAWRRTQTGGEILMRPPYAYHRSFRFEVGAWGWHDEMADVEATAALPTGTTVGTSLTFTADHFTWSDFTPEGYQCSLSALPGWLVLDSPQNRHRARLECQTGTRLGAHTGFLTNWNVEARYPGNPNFSAYLGSRGARGLEDGRYWNAAYAYVNAELRHAVPLAARWALQGVLFTDAAAYAPMAPDGSVLGVREFTSVGAGVRLIPTFLAQLLVRVDGALVLVPESRTFFQFGFQQYF